MLQLSKISKRATGWVDQTPSHATTPNSLLMNCILGSFAALRGIHESPAFLHKPQIRGVIYHRAITLLRSIPQLGPIRSAQIVATADTPHRFRTKRQFWMLTIAKK